MIEVSHSEPQRGALHGAQVCFERNAWQTLWSIIDSFDFPGSFTYSERFSLLVFYFIFPLPLFRRHLIEHLMA
jgi:hypothetical protein